LSIKKNVLLKNEGKIIFILKYYSTFYTLSSISIGKNKTLHLDLFGKTNYSEQERVLNNWPTSPHLTEYYLGR